MTPASLPPLAFLAITGSAGPAQLSLQPGTVLSALVLAKVDASTLRLLLGGETIDLATDRSFAPGTPVEVVVEGTSARPELSVRPLPESRTQAPSHLQPSQSQPSQSQDVQRAAYAALGSVSALAIEAAVTSVAALVGSAAARQGGLAPLYANLESALARSDLPLPQPVASAARQLLSLRLDLAGDGDVGAAGIKAALQRSGLAFEPSVAPSGLQTPVQADLRAALQGLRDTLKAWAEAEPLPQQHVGSSQRSVRSEPHAAPFRSSFLPSVSNVPSAPLASHSDNVQPRATAPQLTEGTMPPPPSRPVASTSGGDGASVANAPPRSNIFDSRNIFESRGIRGAYQSPPGQAGLRAALQALSETLQGWEDAQLPAPQVPAQSIRNPGALFAAPRAVNLAPPFRNAPMEPQPAALPTVLADASPGEIARQLLDDTDAAIARQTLLQIASLPDDGGGGPQPARDAASNMTFEIPLSAGQGTAVAQLRIERDGAEQRGDSVEPVWRVSFSIDLEPIGPVHARISLTGDRAAVFLKAERSESADQLAHHLPLLEAGLRNAELEPGTLLCRTGVPDAPCAATGVFLDQAT